MRAPLWNRGFISLLATQFFEASGDNVIKTALAFAVAKGGPWSANAGAGGQGWVTFAFSLPFILLSAWGGRAADRFSKRSTTLFLKTLSIGVALVALAAWGRSSVSLAFVALVLFATVSSFFGPVKYGMIPELVDRTMVGKANAIVNLSTNVAVIAGIFVAGDLSDLYKRALAGTGPAWHEWLVGLVMLGAAIGGLATCAFLPRLPAQNPTLAFQPNPLSTYWESLVAMARGPLLVVALAWTFFYFLAAVVLSILPDYGSLLGVSDKEIGGLMAALGVSIGAGCIVAAQICGAVPRPALVPLGGTGLAVMFLALGLAPPNYFAVAGLLSLLGFVAGFYIIPLQFVLQALSPDDSRGRFLGTANAMSFTMGAIGGVLFTGLRTAGMPSNRIFLVIAALTAIVSVLMWRWLRRRRAQLERATPLDSTAPRDATTAEGSV